MMEGITRLLMVREAVASYNIEHPNTPMTVEEYFLRECIAADKAARKRAKKR